MSQVELYQVRDNSGAKTALYCTMSHSLLSQWQLALITGIILPPVSHVFVDCGPFSWSATCQSIDFLLVQSISGLVICYMLEHMICQVTCSQFDHVRPDHMMV
jgi:hypothetical protein